MRSGHKWHLPANGNTMQNVYTISTVDSFEYKSLACGRTNDITALLDHISHGHSVALFGERRIGKTTLLLLVRDIISGEIEQYQDNLIDRTFCEAIPSLRTKVRYCEVKYLDLQGKNPHSFVSHLFEQFSTYTLDRDLTLQKSSNPTSNSLDHPEETDNKSSDHQRLVVLIDEVEALFDFKEYELIFRSLRNIIQSYPRICFVLAGAELWHQAIKEKTSALTNNVFAVYLKSAEAYPVENYLVKQQMKNYLSSSTNLNSLSKKIREWTGEKPWYVQATCYEIVKISGESQHLPADWETTIENNVFAAVGPTLQAFFKGGNLDDATRKILALLANRPGLSVRKIAQGLGSSDKLVWDKIVDLEALDKVRKQGSDYYIVGTLLQKYGKRTQEVPRTRSKWPQLLKWSLASALVFLAVWLYWFTHPSYQEISLLFPAGNISIRMPSSLERDETGRASISVHNTTATETYSITLSLVSPDIDYKHNNSNRAVFGALLANETRYWEPEFSVITPHPSPVLTSTVFIDRDAGQFVGTYPFEIAHRPIPFKKYWAVVSLLLVTIGGILTKQDLSPLIVSLVTGLLKQQKDADDEQGVQ